MDQGPSKAPVALSTGGDAASIEPDRVRRGSVGRRRLLRNSTAVAAGLGAAAWVSPSMRSIGVSDVLAISGDVSAASGGTVPGIGGNNGVGNGPDPQPPGSPPINDGPGTGPGTPGNSRTNF